MMMSGTKVDSIKKLKYLNVPKANMSIKRFADKEVDSRPSNFR